MKIQIVRPPHTLPSEPIWSEVKKLRRECWKDYPKAPSGQCDDEDSHACHWLVTVEGELVASARASIYSAQHAMSNEYEYEGLKLNTPIGSINRLVVAPLHRGRGIAGQLDNLRLAYLRQAGCQCVVAESWSARVEHLAGLGFIKRGLSVDKCFHYPPGLYRLVYDFENENYSE